MAVSITVNGRRHTVDVDPNTPVLWVLRDSLGLTGPKYGCGIGQCGACTIHLNGKPTRSCVLPVRTVANADITTIEGLSGKEADAVEQAWTAMDVPQCGYCQSGQIMSAVGLLKQTPKPDDSAIDAAMNGNVCRCASYVRIRAAIHEAAKSMEG